MYVMYVMYVCVEDDGVAILNGGGDEGRGGKEGNNTERFIYSSR
mgnify:FL=1